MSYTKLGEKRVNMCVHIKTKLSLFLDSVLIFGYKPTEMLWDISSTMYQNKIKITYIYTQETKVVW